MCVLEGMEAGFATASGMSAVFATFLSFLKKGDHLISCNAILEVRYRDHQMPEIRH
jgi:O-succinylhomoserine sulfhydrylase